VLGRRWFGLPGAIAGFLGLMALPFVWVLALAMLYADWATNPAVRAVVSGIGVAAAGLFIGTGDQAGAADRGQACRDCHHRGLFRRRGHAAVPLLIVLPVAAALALIASKMRAL
jgi:hypothetical protein